MRAKEYLRQIAVLDKRINSKIKQLNSLKSGGYSVAGISYDKEPVQGGAPSDSMANMVTRWIDLEVEVNEMIDGYVRLKDKIINQINELEDGRYVELLHLRYVDCLTFEKIAEQMHYTLRWTHAIHGQALQEFTRLHCSSLL